MLDYAILNVRPAVGDFFDESFFASLNYYHIFCATPKPHLHRKRISCCHSLGSWLNIVFWQSEDCSVMLHCCCSRCSLFRSVGLARGFFDDPLPRCALRTGHRVLLRNSHGGVPQSARRTAYPRKREWYRSLQQHFSIWKSEHYIFCVQILNLEKKQNTFLCVTWPKCQNEMNTWNSKKGPIRGNPWLKVCIVNWFTS